ETPRQLRCWWPRACTHGCSGDAASRAHRGLAGCHLLRLLPAIPFLHLRELAVKNFATPPASGEVGNVPFLGCSLSRESNDRLEAKIDRLLSETPDKPSPVRLSGGSRSPG